MAIKLGKGAKVSIGTNEIGKITSFGPGLSMETVESKVYGDEWAKPVVTIRNMTCSIEGWLDPTDAQQASLLSEVVSAGDTANPENTCEINDLRFYEDATNYWTSDTSTDSDAHFVITSFSWNPDQNGLVSFSMDVASFGPVHRTS